MKTKIKLLARLLMVTLLFSFIGCSEDVYENHTHSNSGKDEISFKQFISETGITKFDYYKKANVSNSTNIQARTIESEFITDTTGIKKYVNPIDNKTTYSFKIYPIAEALESKEYYNLVYEKYGNEWNEIIFFNTEKSNPTDARKLESSEMVYNRISGREGFSEVITYSIQCDGSCNGVCDGFACPTGQCIKTTIKYVYTGIQDTSSGFNGNPVAGNPSNTNPGGTGDLGNGIFIPNPYNGEADTNNQAFQLAGQVASFTNTLPANLQSLISNYNFVYPYIVDFCRNNGAVVNQANKQQITNALNNFANFQLNNNYNNLTNVNKDRFNFWAFYTFLNNNPLNINNTKINDIKTFVQSAEFETANSIVDYLYENKESQEAIDFAEQCINQINQSPNTFTSIKPFLIEKKIDATQLDPCSSGVFQQVKNTTNNDFVTVLAKLDANGSVYNTTIKTETLPNGNTNPAATIRTSAYNYTIYISPEYEGKTKLFIASLQLHELLHAYFLSLIDDCFIQNNCQLLATFPELWEYYVSVCDNQYPSNQLSHHEQIANKYVSAIANALQEFQPGLPQQVYDDLAWSGLEGTNVFNTLHPIGSSSRQRILNRKAAEQSGHPIAEGTPQEQINYGQPCN